MVKWKICADASCMTAVPKGTPKCKKHKKEEDKRRTGWVARPSKRNTMGRATGHKWMAIRRRVIQRDFGLCQICKAEGRLNTGEEVDHIEHMGTDDMDNLQTICITHHKAKTRAESLAGQRKARGIKRGDGGV